MTDVATGWTINRSVKNKAAIWVTEAIDYATAALPLPDPGHRLGQRQRVHQREPARLLHRAKDHLHPVAARATRTTARHVEQKNWTHVRELVGYLRFDTDAELEVLNAIWAKDALFTNHLLAQQKLIERQRIGSKVTKRYDRAADPRRADHRLGGAHRGQGPLAAQGHHRDCIPADLSGEITELDRAARAPGPHQGSRPGAQAGQRGLQLPAPSGHSL